MGLHLYMQYRCHRDDHLRDSVQRGGAPLARVFGVEHILMPYRAYYVAERTTKPVVEPSDDGATKSLRN